MRHLITHLPPDKLRHYLAGTLLASAGGLHSVLAGALLCAAFAIGKEAYDEVTGRGRPDVLDALATLLGALPVLLPLSLWRLTGGL